MKKKKAYTPLKKCKFKKNDKVIVVAGRNKGKVGNILRIDTGRSVAYVKDVNVVKKAVKKRSQEQQGGITSIEAPIHISNIMIVAKNGKKSRIGFNVTDKKKVRVAVSTREQI